MRSGQAEPVHFKFILFGLAAEDGVIVQEQTGLVLSGLLHEGVGRAQTGKPAAHHHQIEVLAGVLDVAGAEINPSIADAVGGVDHRRGVAVGAGVVADPAVAGPVRPHPLQGGLRRRPRQARRVHGQQGRAAADQAGVDKIAPGDVLAQS